MPSGVRARATSSSAPVVPSSGTALGRRFAALRWLLIANVIAQSAIILTGGLVRLTGSGLGCPTWPQCVPGSFTPVATQEQGWHKYIEFGNRMMTIVLAFIAAALLIVAAWRLWKTRRRFVLACAIPFLGVVAQAVVGGIIVLTKLDPRTVSPHFLLSLVLVAQAVWLLVRYGEGDGRAVLTVPRPVAIAGGLTAVVGAIVMVLGTAVTGSGPHSGDANQPVRFGFDPRATSWLHADAVMLFTGLVVAMVLAARLVTAPSSLRRGWDAVLAVCVLQAAIGYTQYALKLPAALVAAHLVGSALLTIALTFAVTALRRRA